MDSKLLNLLFLTSLPGQCEKSKMSPINNKINQTEGRLTEPAFCLVYFIILVHRLIWEWGHCIGKRKIWQCQEFCANWFAAPDMNEVSQKRRRPQWQPSGASYSCISCCSTGGCQPHGAVGHRPT